MIFLKTFLFFKRLLIPHYIERNFYLSNLWLKCRQISLRKLGGLYYSVVAFSSKRNIWKSSCLVRTLLKMVLPRVNVSLWCWRAEKSNLSSTLSRCTDNLMQKYSIRFVKIWNLGYNIIFTCWYYYDHGNDKDWMYENWLIYVYSHVMKQKRILFLGSVMRVPCTISHCSKSHYPPFLWLKLLHVRAICISLHFLCSV